MTSLTTDTGPIGFTYGTVFTFTKDMSVTFPGRNRRPGVHFIYTGVSPTGYCFGAWDTQRQCREVFMNEDWLVRYMRIIGHITTVPTTEED
jgi:hypothetical protein